MLKSQRAAYLTWTLILDILALSLAFVAAWALRDSLGNILLGLGRAVGYPLRGMVRDSSEASPIYRILLSPNPLVGFKSHLLIFYLAAPAWLFFLNAQRGYDSQETRNSRQQFALCAYAGMLGTAAFLVLLFLIKFQVSRLLILNFMLFGIGFLWVARTVVLPTLQRRGRQPIRHLLVIGNREAAERFAAILKTPVHRASRLAGFVSDEEESDMSTSDMSTHAADEASKGGYDELKNLGRLSELASVLDKQVVDEVILVRSHSQSMGAPGVWGDVLELCLQRGRTVSLVDDMVPPVGAKIEASMMGTMPTLVLHNTPQNTLGLALKNLMDRTLALIALIVFAPLLAAIALAIKITAPGPVLFKQKRVGLNGRQFSFYKFRSMIINAEKFKEEHPEIFAQMNTMSGPFFKSEDDPRVTRVGRFLRKYSLDELPQFWNVLRGDMSLVGPRPPLPREVEGLEPWQRRKLSVKGGLTCLWQVSGRNEIDTDEWMRLDLEYIDNWSLWLDIKLLFKTVKVMVKPKGAS